MGPTSKVFLPPKCFNQSAGDVAKQEFSVVARWVQVPNPRLLLSRQFAICILDTGEDHLW